MAKATTEYTVKAVKEVLDHEGATILQCSVYKNGKKIGHFAEDSWGGPAHLHMPMEEAEELMQYAKTCVDKKYAKYHEAYAIWMSDLCVDYLQAREFKRKCKTRTLYNTPTLLEDGRYGELTLPWLPQHKDRIVAYLDKEYGKDNYEIINRRFE